MTQSIPAPERFPHQLDHLDPHNPFNPEDFLIPPMPESHT